MNIKKNETWNAYLQVVFYTEDVPDGSEGFSLYQRLST